MPVRMSNTVSLIQSVQVHVPQTRQRTVVYATGCAATAEGPCGADTIWRGSSDV